MKAPGVYAKTTDLFDLVDRGEQFEKIAGGFGFTEGPVCSRIGFVLFSDLRSEKIHKMSSGGRRGGARGGEVTTFREKSNRANGLTFDHQGRLLACETGPGRVTRTEKDGSITVMADRWGGKRLSSPNDLVYNIDGTIYFTDMPRADAPDASERTMKPAVYRISRSQIPGKAKLDMASEECKRANGVALGPKQNQLYMADGGSKNIRVQDIRDDGSLAPGRVFAEFESDEEGGLDGLKTDELGNVYCTGPGGIWVFNAQGHHLGTLVPPEQPSNLNWGSGFGGLYVTARTSVYYLRTKVPGTRTY